MNSIDNSTAIFLQARSDSRRLPCKVHLHLSQNASQRQGQSVIQEVMRRLQRVSPNIPVFVLIPKEDFLLREVCQQNSWNFFCGPKEDVRERYRLAAQEFAEFRIIVRACCDNPCVDPVIIRKAIDRCTQKNADYYSFAGLPVGSQAECVSRRALLQDGERVLSSPQEHREHVTMHIQENPQMFRVFRDEEYFVSAQEKFMLPSSLRLTLDTPEDYLRLCKVFFCLPVDFSILDVLELCKKKKYFASPRQDTRKS